MNATDRIYEKVMGAIFSSVPHGADLRLGRAALSNGTVTEERLAELEREVRETGGDLGLLLVRRGHLTLPQYLELLEGAEEVPEAPAQRVGKCRLVREIARGGMGIVYVREATPIAPWRGRSRRTCAAPSPITTRRSAFTLSSRRPTTTGGI